MSRTSKVQYIAMDTHGKTTSICVKTRVDGPVRQWTVPTTISGLREVIEQVERPRKLVFEEGPLADWLLRNLQEHVDELVVSDPRRNALIAKESDKDDPIDAGKLCDLFMGKYIKAVHHPQSRERAIIKQVVGLYAQQMRLKVQAANQVIGYAKRWGVVVREGAFARADARRLVMGRMPADAAVVGMMEVLLSGYDHAERQARGLRRQLTGLGKRLEVVVRWTAIPGISWVRGMMLYAYLDTPWRFKSRQGLWKYMGIGLVRAQSGSGPEKLKVERACNRELKNVIVGAAQTVMRMAASKENPYRERFDQWMREGLRQGNARRNVARALANTVLGMWKNGGVYEPGKVFGGGVA